MYAARWSPGLRQGDVFGEVPFPLAKTRLQWIVSAVGSTEPPTQSQIDVSLRYAVVLSHDCEFNEGKRTHFLVGRIESLDPRLTPEQLEELRLGNDIHAAARGGRTLALDSFILDPLSPAFEDHRRLNFAAVVSFPFSYEDSFIGLKKAELTHEARVMLREKLGFFFGRPAEDIDDAEKSLPTGDSPDGD